MRWQLVHLNRAATHLLAFGVITETPSERSPILVRVLMSPSKHSGDQHPYARLWVRYRLLAVGMLPLDRRAVPLTIEVCRRKPQRRLTSGFECVA